MSRCDDLFDHFADDLRGGWLCTTALKTIGGRTAEPGHTYRFSALQLACQLLTQDEAIILHRNPLRLSLTHNFKSFTRYLRLDPIHTTRKTQHRHTAHWSHECTRPSPRARLYPGTCWPIAPSPSAQGQRLVRADRPSRALHCTVLITALHCTVHCTVLFLLATPPTTILFSPAPPAEARCARQSPARWARPFR